MKKILCMVLAAIMLLGCMAGCGSSSSTATTAAATQAAATEAAAAGETEAAAENAYADHITISWTEVIEQDEGNDYTQDAIYKTFADKFNVDFDIRPLTWGNWTSNVNLYITGMNLPDVTNWYYNYTDYANYVEQELLYKLPSDWEERWPGVAEVYEKTGLKGVLEDENGDIYCLPVPVYFNNKPVDQMPTHIQVYARKDWIEQVTGEEVKDSYTWTELHDILVALKEANPAGIDNFYPFDAYSSMLVQGLAYAGYEHISSGFDIYKNEDGEYVWGPGDEETYETLERLHEWYQEGLIYPEFYNQNQGEDEDNMTIAHTTAMFCAGGLAANYILFTNEQTQSGLDPDESLCSFFVTDDDGVYHSAEATNYFGALIFNPDIDDAKFERIMDVIEYALSVEGQDLIFLGIEGTDFTKNDDGTYNMLHEYTTSDLYPSNRFFCTLAARADDFSIINPSYLAKATAKQKTQYEEKYSVLNNSLAEIDWNYTNYVSDAKTSLGSQQSNYVDEYAKLIATQGDLRSEWEAWVSDMQGYVQPVLNEMNELYGG